MWTPPKTDELTAAFFYDGGTLTPTDDTSPDVSIQTRAEQTLSAWQAAFELQDATMLVLKSEGAVSLALASGGLIIEGRGKLNLGLVRASAKTLPKIVPPPAKAHVPQANRFRTVFWQAFQRIAGAALTRNFVFKIGENECAVFVRDHALTFTGDANSPAEFVERLKTAAEAGHAIDFTLADTETPPEGDTYRPIDLITSVCEPGADRTAKFDPDGWPLVCSPEISADHVLVLSGLASTACEIHELRNGLTLSVLSADNRPVVQGTMTSDGSMEFKLL